MKTFEKRCSKCLMNYTAFGGLPINFCQKCGSLLEVIGMRGEQPFHLSDDWKVVQNLAIQSANRVNEILFEYGDGLPGYLVKSLKGCAKVLGDIAQEKGTRKETRGMLGKIKERENSLDGRLRDHVDGLIRPDVNWDEQLKKLK